MNPTPLTTAITYREPHQDGARNYWDQYYAGPDLPTGPSQFAQFVQDRFPSERVVLELGPGNGRDATFWSSQGKSVVAVDQSSAAIEWCRNSVGDDHGSTFIVGDIEAPATWNEIEIALDNLGIQQILVFARFFMHSLSDSAEDVVLSRLHSLLKKYDGKVCLEFRTISDEHNQRVTPDHFRRYIDPQNFTHKLEVLGFQVDYLVEGLGFAKYKNDDAYVARVIASLNES